MAYRLVISVIAAMALISMSCGISFKVPVDRIVTGPTVTDDVQIYTPDSNDIELTLAFGAGEFDLKGGAGSTLVDGTISYNVADLKPRIEVEGGEVSLRSGNLSIDGIPKLDDKVVNHWDLALGDAPMALKIQAGAYEGDYELGGLALTNLEISDGAADVRLDFSEPNRVEMDDFRYTTGASTLRMRGLANANFKTMTFRSGLGDYTLDFSGELRRDADVNIETGLSKVVLIVPTGTRAQVIVSDGLSNVDADTEWSRSGRTYTLGSGSGPLLTIHVQMGAGDLQLRAN